MAIALRSTSIEHEQQQLRVQKTRLLGRKQAQHQTLTLLLFLSPLFAQSLPILSRRLRPSFLARKLEFFAMEGFGASPNFKKKRRSATSRRPRPDSQFVVEGTRDGSSHSSTPSSDNGSKPSLDENPAYAPRTTSVNNIEGSGSLRKIRKEDRKYGDISGFYESNRSSRGCQPGDGLDSKRSSEGVLAPANWKSSGTENRLKKVKLKVGGVTRTFHPKSISEHDVSGVYTSKPSGAGDASRPHRQKLILQDNSDDDHAPAESADGLQGGIYGEGCLPRGPKDQGILFEESSYGKQMPISEPVRKSKRVPKRRVLDGALDEGNEDDEIRYLEKLKASKVSTDNSEFEDDGEESVKKKSITKVSISKSKKVAYHLDEDYGSSRSAKDSRKKSRTVKEFVDNDYIEEDELGSEDGIEDSRKKLRKESLDTLPDARSEPLTTRQRALQSGKGASLGESLVEFPNGLPPAPPRKQKEKLSEVEQQAKKAEAAQRRRMQVEKAARESEAEAIRKILGQDSNRKKKEEKLRKERDQLAQKRAAESLVLASNSIRCVMGPTSTIVTFGEDVGLPSIFEAKPSSYPPAREKCAAPSCQNTYKYRDSKSNLPLCSLQCYKTVQGSSQTISTW
ncbi:uncharacterized protein A4U43_C08F19640 [Asparagus officinalis]|uniref:titin homolog n=1 Tax=Asparagus officinalis TaxID=4686 RepID=UPI00098E3E61|nr:titin homolog [Asparagus officinalis]ONK60537.1 uncharacterized protein A4U43_C08F19640 [Asparagus officinalis]